MSDIRAMVEREAMATKCAHDDRDLMRLVLAPYGGGGVAKSIPLMSARLSLSMDTLNDVFSGDFDWVPGRDTDIDALVRPYSYASAYVYIGGQAGGEFGRVLVTDTGSL